MCLSSSGLEALLEGAVPLHAAKDGRGRPLALRVAIVGDGGAGISLVLASRNYE